MSVSWQVVPAVRHKALFQWKYVLTVIVKSCKECGLFDNVIPIRLSWSNKLAILKQAKAGLAHKARIHRLGGNIARWHLQKKKKKTWIELEWNSKKDMLLLGFCDKHCYAIWSLLSWKKMELGEPSSSFLTSYQFPPWKSQAKYFTFPLCLPSMWNAATRTGLAYMTSASTAFTS